MGSCAAPSAKGDDKFITTDYLQQCPLVDATIIEAPSSTKNKEQQRDPEMHQTKKGNQWHFGMKAHIGVDAKSNLSQPMPATKERHSARSWPRWMWTG